MGSNQRFTEEGLKVIVARAKSLTHLYNETDKYPIKVRVLGFRNLEVDNKEDLLSRLKELCDWTRGCLKEIIIKKGEDEKVMINFVEGAKE